MKIVDSALFGIAAVAIYKIAKTFRYSIPVQEPQESKPSTITNLDQSKMTQEQLPLVDAYVAQPKDSQQTPATTPAESGSIHLAPRAEKAVRDTISDPQKRSYENNPRFYYLKPKTQNTLIRNFAQDYTSPRMIDDDSLYSLCVRVSNDTGAPCGWVQSLAVNGSDPMLMYIAADCMLNYFDDNIDFYNSIDDCRLDAISLARTLL